ncbi:MAG: prenyltransferase/squalene oxidase repeat-containing protein [Planctomycetota bacterium]
MKHTLVRRSAMVMAVAACTLANRGVAHAQESAASSPAAGEIVAGLDGSIERGLAYLAANQDPDGAWSGGRFGRNVAITSVACIALLADGHAPGRGAYGEAVQRGLDFVLSAAAENGLIAADAANGPMYGHGFAALFLGEVYGMTRGGGDTAQSRRLHDALVRAVRLIERTQNDEGGWRYNPVPYDADVSVTVCMVMALRSARNAGIEVDAGVIDRAVEYVRRCQNPDGGFKYQLQGGSSAWPRTAAGVATLFYAGIYSDDSIDEGLAYLKRAAGPASNTSTRAHYFYGHYYAVQAHFLAGGEHWAFWWPGVRDELLGRQLADGSWEDRSVGPAYGTAMALIVLQMPKRYLPIFQK